MSQTLPNFEFPRAAEADRRLKDLFNKAATRRIRLSDVDQFSDTCFQDVAQEAVEVLFAYLTAGDRESR